MVIEVSVYNKDICVAIKMIRKKVHTSSTTITYKTKNWIEGVHGLYEERNCRVDQCFSDTKENHKDN